MIHRRHHCRLCGAIICGSGNCSRWIPLTESHNRAGEEKLQQRSCINCQNLLKSHPNDQHSDKKVTIPICSQLETNYSVRLIHTASFLISQSFSKVRDQIEDLLLKYQEVLTDLESERQSFARAQSIYEEAMMVRNTVTLQFQHFDKSW